MHIASEGIKAPAVVLVAALTLLAVACGTGTPTAVTETLIVPAGELVSWDVSEFEECQYHLAVTQTGALGRVDIEFQGQRYTEKDGVFYGDTFALNNGYSLSTAKVVDIRLRCM